MSATILLVEDDHHYIIINRETLTMRGYKVIEAKTVSEAKFLFEQNKPDIIILDIMLPDGSGIDLCKEIRRTDNNIPILFLSALGQPEEVVAGLKVGGDDYLPKPYDLDVLVMRVDSILRRHDIMPKTITKGRLTLRISSNQAFIDGVDIGLSQNIEFSMICLFVQEEGKVLSPEYLYEEIWGQPMVGSDNPVRYTISSVRKKLKGSGYTIASRHGEGYIFEKV